MEMRANQGLAGLLAAGLTVGAVAAHAADDKTGFYIGAGVGNANVQDSVGNGEAGHVNFDGDDTSFKVFGGYMFLPWLGVEIAYMDLGNPEDNFPQANAKIEASADGWTGELIGQVPIGPVDLFAKVGVVDWSADLTLKDTLEGGTIAKANDDGDDLSAGAGAAFNIGSFAIRGEYQYFDIGDGVDVWTLSAIWHL
jgi:OOP family OmpA-OmpF porin